MPSVTYEISARIQRDASVSKADVRRDVCRQLGLPAAAPVSVVTVVPSGVQR